jgi:phosphoglycolate phosphatase-like HAD superfamily hydrolase
MVTHIVWDWNGTIFDDGGALIGATIETFATAGFPPVTVELYQRNFTQPISAFYERLAGRPLSDDEQVSLDRLWRATYERHRATTRLALDAVPALEAWASEGGTQSLLSMYTHDLLIPLVRASGIEPFFTRVDGRPDRCAHVNKAPYLRRHLRHLGLPADRIFMIGDSRDDVLAARECGVACAVYHSGPTALHERAHLDELGVPIAESLLDAVELALSYRRGAPSGSSGGSPNGASHSATDSQAV